MGIVLGNLATGEEVGSGIYYPSLSRLREELAVLFFEQGLESEKVVGRASVEDWVGWR